MDSLCSCADAIRDLEKGLNEAMAHIQNQPKCKMRGLRRLSAAIKLSLHASETNPRILKVPLFGKGIATYLNKSRSPLRDWISRLCLWATCERSQYEMKLEFKGMVDQLVKDVHQSFKKMDTKVFNTVSKANDLYKKLGEDIKKRLTFMDSRVNKLETVRTSRPSHEEGSLGNVFSAWFDEEPP